AALAADLVRLNVHVIVTPTEAGTRAAKEATKGIPVVMVGVNYDPIALGFVDSLAHPGTNVTGLFFLHLDLLAKRFELFKGTVSAIKRVAVLADIFTAEQLKTLHAANRSQSLTLESFELQNPPDLEDAFRRITRARAEAVFVLESAPIYKARSEIAQLA